jgi:hypothetical protein
MLSGRRDAMSEIDKKLAVSQWQLDKLIGLQVSGQGDVHRLVSEVQGEIDSLTGRRRDQS